MQEPEITQRIAWIDSVKAIAIILVIVVHTIGLYTPSLKYGAGAYTFWHSLHMFIYILPIPLFFFISGWLFNFDKYLKRPLQFIASRIKTLLVPYIFFSVIVLIIYSVISGQNIFTIEPPITLVTDIITTQGVGNIISWLWFLPSLFIVEVMYYILSRFLYPEREGLLKALMVIVGLFGVITGIHLTFMTALIFYGMGHLYRKSEERDYDEENVENIWYPIVGFILFLIIQNYLPNSIWTPSNILSYAFSTAVVLMGVISITRLIRWFYQKNKIFDVLEIIGKNCMIFYIMHGLILMIFKSYLPAMGTPVDMLIISCLVMALCYPFIRIFRSYAPFLVGMKN